MDYQALAVAQEQDRELRDFRHSTSSLQLKERDYKTYHL